jgi:hypothetical protein
VSRLGLFLLPLFLAATVLARPEPVDPIMQGLRRAQAQAPGWSARVTVDIDVPGLRVKGKRVELAFTPPDSFAFQARGFALLPRRAFMWTADSLFAGLSDPRALPGRPGDPRGSVRMTGLFREEGLLARMEYRVDTLRWLVTQVSAWQDGLEAVRLDNEWVQVGRGVWLPAAVRMRMSFSPAAQRFYERMRGAMRRREAPREGAGTITMTFDRHKLKLGS